MIAFSTRTTFASAGFAFGATDSGIGVRSCWVKVMDRMGGEEVVARIPLARCGKAHAFSSSSIHFTHNAAFEGGLDLVLASGSGWLLLFVSAFWGVIN